MQEESYKKQSSGVSDVQNRDGQSGRKRTSINQRFILQTMIPIGFFYKTYKGVDTVSRKYVTIYLKPTSKQRTFSKNIKEELRQKVAPPFKWAGSEKIDKNIFDVEVHAKYGPSLHEIMTSYRRIIAQKTLYLLCYHLLKLIDRVDSAGYVNRSLNLRNIILGENYQKNELYFLNTFDFERKGDEPSIFYDPKYCSIGTHLKLKTSTKDTLQSMCYALMDFYLKGNLFGSIKCQKEKSYLQAKTILKPEGIPFGFIQFFQYVKNLNFGEEVKFTEWKIKFKKLVPQHEYSKPYEWIQAAKQKGEDKSMNQASNILMNLFSSEISSKNNKIAQIEPQQNHHHIFEHSQDELEFEEGELCEEFSVTDKIMKVQAFNIKN